MKLLRGYLNMRAHLIVFTMMLGMVLNLSVMPAQAQGETTIPENYKGDQKFEGFNLKGYAEDGSEAWDVKGDTADVQGSDVILSNVNANAFGEQKVNVTAESGKINQVSGKMLLEKDVVITSEDGTQLSTDTLHWDRNADEVSTEDDVLITDDEYNFSVSGKGMKAKPQLKNAEIKKDVTVRVDTEPDTLIEKILTITSDGPMMMDQAIGMATFEDNVFAIQDDQTLKADRMEVYFDQKLNQISKVVCIGNVEVTRGENKTYAEKAVFDNATQKLSLYGRPKLILLTEGEGAITSFGD